MNIDFVSSPLRRTLAILFFLSIASAWGEPVERRLAGFGSSVCYGQGDEMSNGGYMGRLRDRLTPKGWFVTNASRGGDNTVKIQERWDPASPKRSNITIKPNQYLLPMKPNFVWVGLSLNNEGLRKAEGEGADAVVAEQWVKGMEGIFDRLRKNGIMPASGNCYANSAFTPEDYEASKAMNLQIHTWEVPSANLLGAVDDGTGKWCEGFFHDRSHPNSAGHWELMEAIVPSLFDAMAAGRKQPVAAPEKSGLKLPAGNHGGIACQPEFPWHGLSVSFRFQGTGTMTLVELEGRAQDRKIREVIGKKSTNRICEWIPSPSDEKLALKVAAGKLTLGTADCGTAPAAGSWHWVTLTSRPAANFVNVFLDGVEVGRISRALFVSKVSILPTTASPASLKEICIYRSALNGGEVKAQLAGTLLRSSLEVHGPLTDSDPKAGGPLVNDAVSLTPLLLVAKGTTKL